MLNSNQHGFVVFNAFSLAKILSPLASCIFVSFSNSVGTLQCLRYAKRVPRTPVEFEAIKRINLLMLAYVSIVAKFICVAFGLAISRSGGGIEQLFV